MARSVLSVHCSLSTDHSPPSAVVAVVHCCGRDAGLLPHFRRMWEQTWPGCGMVLAEDPVDPLPHGAADGLPVVPCHWQIGPRARAVLDAMVLAALEFPAAEWIVKTDVDVAHLSRAWLDGARADSRMVALQNGTGGWAGILGMAFALRRRLLMEIHAGEECNRPGPETQWILAAARKRALNEVWVWPHAPRQGGLYASMLRPEKAALYRETYSLVNCGVFPRERAAKLMAGFGGGG